MKFSTSTIAAVIAATATSATVFYSSSSSYSIITPIEAFTISTTTTTTTTTTLLPQQQQRRRPSKRSLHPFAAVYLSSSSSSSSSSSLLQMSSSSSSTTTTSDTKDNNATPSSASSSTKYTIGIVGATGAVGKEIRQVLETRHTHIPISSLHIYGSERSAGTQITSTQYGTITVQLFDVEHVKQTCDIVFLAVNGDFSLQYARDLSSGPNACIVIDNSSAFRYEKDVPLVVPEINGEETKKGKLIANPNCTTAIGLMALYPLHKAFVLKKIIMSTYQAASGAGQPGMDELLTGTQKYLNNEPITNEIFAHPLPFNVIPQIDKFQDNGYTKEEMKVVWETRKICHLDDDFPISCTAVRIPTIRAHSESIIVETERPVDIEVARQVLSEQSGLLVVDDTTNLQYPMPIHCTGQYDVQVGRLRKSLIYNDYGIEFFVCGDQLLRGAALNAVLIAEIMIQNGSISTPSKQQQTV